MQPCCAMCDNVLSTLGLVIPEDCPPGYQDYVAMLKTDTGGLCRRCFYIKRGSLNNMRISELVQHLEHNETFADKFLS